MAFTRVSYRYVAGLKRWRSRIGFLRRTRGSKVAVPIMVLRLIEGSWVSLHRTFFCMGERGEPGSERLD